jgi:MFS family permease
MILAALLLAAFLVNLDTTLVNVALPTLVRQLHATTTQLQWVVRGYGPLSTGVRLLPVALSVGAGSVAGTALAVRAGEAAETAPESEMLDA